MGITSSVMVNFAQIGRNSDLVEVLSDSDLEIDRRTWYYRGSRLNTLQKMLTGEPKLYRSHVRSKLDYGCVVYGSAR